MEQIAIFMSPYSLDIETEVNAFLSENNVKFIDIKYIHEMDTEQYSALLVYEEVED